MLEHTKSSLRLQSRLKMDRNSRRYEHQQQGANLQGQNGGHTFERNYRGNRQDSETVMLDKVVERANTLRKSPLAGKSDMYLLNGRGSKLSVAGQRTMAGPNFNGL